jgi:hypothetical protein
LAFQDAKVEGMYFLDSPDASEKMWDQVGEETSTTRVYEIRLRAWKEMESGPENRSYLGLNTWILECVMNREDKQMSSSQDIALHFEMVVSCMKNISFLRPQLSRMRSTRLSGGW